MFTLITSKCSVLIVFIHFTRLQLMLWDQQVERSLSDKLLIVLEMITPILKLITRISKLCKYILYCIPSCSALKFFLPTHFEIILLYRAQTPHTAYIWCQNSGRRAFIVSNAGFTINGVDIYSCGSFDNVGGAFHLNQADVQLKNIWLYYNT